MKSKNFTIFSIYKSLHVQLKTLAWPKSKPCKTLIVRLEPVSHAHPRPFERVERGLYSTNLWHFSGLMVCALFVLGCCPLNLEIRWGRCWTRLRARSTVHLSDYVKYQAIYIAAISSMYPFYWEWLLVGDMTKLPWFWLIAWCLAVSPMLRSIVHLPSQGQPRAGQSCGACRVWKLGEVEVDMSWNQCIKFGCVFSLQDEAQSFNSWYFHTIVTFLK